MKIEILESMFDNKKIAEWISNGADDCCCFVSLVDSHDGSSFLM